MNNKQGFTLIELMVSVGLLSIVLVFMMNTLVKLRDTNIAGGLDTNLLVGQAIISKTINTDILTHGGIREYICTNKQVLITLNDEVTRTITLNEASTNTNANTVLTYKDEENKTILIRKTPANYTYGDFNCSTFEEKLIKIIIPILDHDEYNSEILNYNNI